MTFDVSSFIASHLQPSDLLNLSHTNRAWRQSVHLLPRYHWHIHRVETLSPYHMLLNDTSGNLMPFGYIGLALSVPATRLGLIKYVHLPISSLEITDHRHFSLLPRALHHVNLVDCCLTDPRVVVHCPSIITITRGDISHIPPDFWMHMPCHIRSIKFNRVRVNGPSGQSIPLVCVVSYDNGKPVAADTSHWLNSPFDTVFASVNVLTIRKRPAVSLVMPKLMCHTLYLRTSIGFFEAPKLRSLYVIRGDCYMYAHNMPMLESVCYYKANNRSVYRFPNLHTITLIECTYTMTISSNPKLKTLIIQNNHHQVYIGAGNTELRQVQTTPEIFDRYVIGLFERVPNPDTDLSYDEAMDLDKYHHALSIGAM